MHFEGSLHKLCLFMRNSSILYRMCTFYISTFDMNNNNTAVGEEQPLTPAPLSRGSVHKGLLRRWDCTTTGVSTATAPSQVPLWPSTPSPSTARHHRLPLHG